MENKLTKEDIIGSIWKCPWRSCGQNEIITESGIHHTGHKHFVDMSLEQILEYRNYWKKKNKKLMYGK